VDLLQSIAPRRLPARVVEQDGVAALEVGRVDLVRLRQRDTGAVELLADVLADTRREPHRQHADRASHAEIVEGFPRKSGQTNFAGLTGSSS
jgi:ABC-type transporter Mla MlaB component